MESQSLNSERFRAEFRAELDKAAVRLATGIPTRQLFEDVRVTCRACGGVTVFPLLPWHYRPTPAPCAHCGAAI